MIDHVTLLPPKRCLVQVHGHTLDMSVTDALSQRQFEKRYQEDTGRKWERVPANLFRAVMRNQFDRAGYDFGQTARPHYGKEALQ